MIEPMATAVPEAVDRVGAASLEEFAVLRVDDVYAHTDWLGGARPGPLDLYRRRERQNWRAQTSTSETMPCTGRP